MTARAVTMYRLSWETVRLSALQKYSNADPRFYKNTTQIVPNSEIPDQDWEPVSRETDSPGSQYHTLKAWADADTGFVRSVVFEKAVSEPTWREVSL